MNAAALALVLLLQPSAARSAFGTARPAECGIGDGLRATAANVAQPAP